ncbi:TPA: helix-turn-helix transcriptional regulator, partial [Streptococcus pneumoniae]
SVRSLYAGFREHLGVAPMARLKQMRLEAARRYLQAGGMSVTEVALACGFTHLGQFSADYRHRYGERPSETLSGLSRPRSSI